jgi:predicted ABC-type transport system involved in lysophospholipase L1 biosynthesis ATPase subunit
LLIADEPTSNLDASMAAAIGELLATLRAKGTTLVISTHDPALEARADRRLVLVDGRLQS